MKKNKAAILVVIVATFYSACSMADDLVENVVDLSTLKVTTNPSGSEVIIPATQRELTIEFNRSINTSAAESLVSLTSSDGAVTYDHRWKERCLILTPVDSWKTGTRYVLSCRGTVSASRNRTYTLDTACSFYIDTKKKPPVLLSIAPEQDAVVSRTDPLILHFNAPISETNPERHIEISPEHPVTVSFLDDDQTLRITPTIAWKGLTRYQWIVHNTLCGSSGVPINCQHTGTFRTLSDTTAPKKPGVFVRSIEALEGSYLPLESLANKYGLVFTFNEPIDPDSFIRKMSITPSTHPIVRQLTKTDFLVYPESEVWLAGQEYTITIQKGVEDLYGNLTEKAFSYTVTPSIPLLSVLRCIPDSPVPEGPADFTGKEMTSGTYVYPVAIETLTTRKLVLTLTISATLSSKEAQRLVSSISLEPLFPHYLGSPQSGVVLFDPSADARTVRLTYLDLHVPSREIEEERVLYTFSIQGGPNGFLTDSGASFPETLSIILEVFEKEE